MFVGSLNFTNPYASWRYGNQIFRDLNLLVRNTNPKDVRNFFLEILLQNARYFPEKLNPEKLVKMFDDLDVKYGMQETKYPEKALQF